MTPSPTPCRACLAQVRVPLFPDPPPLPPTSHLHAAGPDSALVAALVAARAAAAEGQAHVRAAALAWEHERDAADAPACQIAEADSSCPPCLT